MVLMKKRYKVQVVVTLLLIVGVFAFASCSGSKKTPCPAYGGIHVTVLH